MKLLSTTQAGKRIGVTGQSIRHYIKEGRLPAELNGKRWFIDPDDLTTFNAIPRRNGRPRLTSVG